MYGSFGSTATLIEAELAGHPAGLSPAIAVATSPAPSGVTIAEAAPSPSADLVAWQSWEFGFDTTPPREASALEDQMQRMRQRLRERRDAPAPQRKQIPWVPILIGGALLLLLTGRKS